MLVLGTKGEGRDGMESNFGGRGRERERERDVEVSHTACDGQVSVYAGDSPASTKVAEYGGNTHGFGSRSVLGKGWPKDLVKVRS